MAPPGGGARQTQSFRCSCLWSVMESVMVFQSFFSNPSSCSEEPAGWVWGLGLFLGQFLQQMLLPGIEVPGE